MPQGDAATLPSNQLLSRVRVLRALGALSSPHPLALRRFRSLNYSGFFLSISGLLSVWLTVRIGAGDVADVMALRIMAYACWLYGGFGLLTMLRPGAFEGTALAPLRGVHLPLGLACFSSLAKLIGRGIAFSSLPALALCVLLSEDQMVRRVRLVQLALSAVYIALCALSLALIGALCITLFPRRARLSAAIILVAPFSLELSGGSFPNLIGALVWGFGKLVAWGAP